MKPEHAQFLNDNRGLALSYSQKEPAILANQKQKETLLKIMREEFNPNYRADLWCKPCIQSLVVDTYTLYDNYLKNETGKH